MKTPRIRRIEVVFLGVIAVAIVVIGVLGGGYQVTPSGFVEVRNGANVPVNVEITQGGFLFLQSASRYPVEPWTDGACLTRLRIEQGDVEIRVIGPQPGRETTTRASVDAGAETRITVDVSADGTVLFGGPLPSDPPSCRATGG